MASYSYKKNYKDLVSQKELLEKSFGEMFENDPRKERLMAWFKDYKQTHESIRKIADDALSDVEYDKETETEELQEEIDELKDDLKELETRFDTFNTRSLEDEMKVELFQVVMKKYTLAQLEERLGGSRFQLM